MGSCCGTNVNHTLVEDGWCWWYRKYAPEIRLTDRLRRECRWRAPVHLDRVHSGPHQPPANAPSSPRP